MVSSLKIKIHIVYNFKGNLTIISIGCSVLIGQLRCFKLTLLFQFNTQNSAHVWRLSALACCWSLSMNLTSKSVGSVDVPQAGQRPHCSMSDTRV